MEIQGSPEDRRRIRRSLWQTAALSILAGPISLAGGVSKIRHFPEVQDPFQVLIAILACALGAALFIEGIWLARQLAQRPKGDLSAPAQRS
jgi:hypothetical protein